MANFVLVIDSDRQRGRYFVENAATQVALVDGLVTQTCQCGDFTAIWAAAEGAPGSISKTATGAAILWGEATRNQAGDIDAERLAQLWGDVAQSSGQAFNGFYAGAVYEPEGGLMVGADLLGTFPVYYWQDQNLLLVGSSPELFKAHPAFREEFNPVGLVGILLTMHMFNGETLLKGVKRLGAGRVLCWQKGKVVQERVQFQLKVSSDHFSLPFSAHVDLLDQAISTAVARQTDTTLDYSLLLSGGLDSRMLAGYLTEKGIKPKALTLGDPSDQEMNCAKRVAKTLGLKHQSEGIRFENYAQYAQHQARWEQVVNGFNTIMSWGGYTSLRTLPPRVVMGHMLDGAVGTSNISWAYSPEQKKMSYERFFEKINAWGIHPDLLKRLLRKEIFGELVDETLEKIKVDYHSCADIDSQRAWSFNLRHRQRFHVGGAAWAFSFGAWPVLPVLDHDLLTTAGAMPAATIAERRGQIELMCRRFPVLASLPLDRNTANTTPLMPRLRYLLKSYTLGRVNRLAVSKKERRYYVRVYDLNGAGWSSVRREAEGFREATLSFFNRDVLKEILLPAETRFCLQNEIIDASGIKSLLGFTFWLGGRSDLFERQSTPVVKQA